MVQPNPRPVPSEMTAVTPPRITPSRPADPSNATTLRLERCQYSRGGACRRAGRVAPHRLASAMPTNPNASTDAILIIADAASSTAPPSSSHPAAEGSHDPGLRSRCGESIPRKQISMPASIIPSMRASLWMPPTRCRMSSGFIAPSHRAATGETPHLLARRGSAQTISATPKRARARCSDEAQRGCIHP